MDADHGSPYQHLNVNPARSISPRKEKGTNVFSVYVEDVHHSNEPHSLGNANESRVDTEV